MQKVSTSLSLVDEVPSRSRGRILIIEDHEGCRRVLFRHLTEWDYECITADTGAEGLALASRRAPDAIILDLRLPDIMGFAVLKWLRQNERTASIPVILMTGESHAQDLLSSAAECFNVRCIQKPLDLAALREWIRKAMKARREGELKVEAGVIRRGCLKIDLGHRLVSIQGKTVRLGAKRFELLCVLARSKDGITGKLLKALVWGSEEAPRNTITKTVNRLRRDLGNICGRDMIVPFPGGYRLECFHCGSGGGSITS